MTKAANLSALGSSTTTAGNISSASTLTLQTNSTTALTIDTSQNVGIGNTAPLAKLVVGAAQTFPDANTTAQFSGQLELCQPSAASYRSQLEVDTTTFYINSNTYYSGGWQVYDSARAPSQITMASNNLSSAISFFTSTVNSGNGTERMRIFSSGGVSIGNTTDPGASNLSVTGTITGSSFSGAVAATTLSASSTVSGTGFSTYLASPPAIGGTAAAAGNFTNSQITSLGVGTAASGTTGEIRATNNVTAFYSSDSRLKENIKDIPSALQKVCAIGSKTFDWTDEVIASKGGEDGYFVKKSDFGVIAQDVQAVFPEAVRTREDGTLAVDYEKLATLSFGAIKELADRIAKLEGK
jgi:hypothetical protein